MNLKGSFQVYRGSDTVLFHEQTMQFPNLNNEQAGQMSEYMDACEKDLAKLAKKASPGTFTVKLIAEVDNTGMKQHVGEGLTYKELVQFQRFMHNHQDKLLKYAEEQAANRPGSPAR